MMTEEGARQVIMNYLTTEVSALYPGMLIVPENYPMPDLQRQAEPFISVECRLMDRQKMEVSVPSIYRLFGLLEITYYTKAGTGTKAVNIFADHIAALFSNKMVSGVVFREARPLTSVSAVGWYKRTMAVPFFFESST